MEPLPPRNTNGISGLRQEGHNCHNPYREPHHFPHRTQGGNLFCSDECRWEASSNARSALRQVRRYLNAAPSLSRRRFLSNSFVLSGSLSLFLDGLPAARTARQEALWNELDQGDKLMLTVGPVSSEIRSTIRARAAAVALALPHPRGLVEESLVVRAHELLRDAGAEGVSKSEIVEQLLPHARFAVQFFQRTRDHLNLGRSLLALGNLYRLADRNREASKVFTWSFWILRELLSGHEFDDRYTAAIIHQAGFWWLRTHGGDIGSAGVITRELKHLTELAHYVNEPALWVEHYRELAGFQKMLLRDTRRAEETLSQLTLTRVALEGRTKYAEPTLLTPAIMLLIETGRERQAKELILGPYLSNYLHHRHLYYYEQLSKWQRICPLPRILQPEYGSAFFAYLPRYDPERTRVR